MEAEELLEALDALLDGERDRTACMANAAALLYHKLDRVNWAGFYLFKRGELVLGPFQGRVACTRIAPGRGVCGAAFAGKRALRVDDVHAFPGHIACDAESRSEIVLPLMDAQGEPFGVLDIDSPVPARFTAADERLLSEAAARIAAALRLGEDA
ncbi:MAG: GAF domain-containing protein [Clostridia bacterium]|nr:GAF domain-containing protein [Clostridia bacterium]